MKNTVTNTTGRMSVDPNPFGGMPASIEASEARGQSQLVESDVIPRELAGVTEDELTELGFILGAEVDGDGMFRDATLPPGWSKKPTDHSMWSRIVDGDGVERFSIFYKAAFYDRSAFMRSHTHTD